jgi:membrane-bound ClpP family serine protease
VKSDLEKEQMMFNARIALILAGLAFAIWETIDIFWISFPAAAAAFAALFLGGTLWLWRRNTLRPALVLLLLFAFEAVVAPTLRAMTVTKVRPGQDGTRNTATHEGLATRLCVSDIKPARRPDSLAAGRCLAWL